MTTIHNWIKSKIDKELVELPNIPISQQLDNYDKAGSGIGFVLLLMKVSTDIESDDPETTHLQIVSLPVIKIQNEWLTPNDENFSDILSGVIRTIAPNKEV